MTKEERLKRDGYGGVRPVLFYGPKNPNGLGSNFSKHAVWLPHPQTGKLTRYPTGEHRFQAMKATDARCHDAIANQPTAGKSKEAGGPRSSVEGFVLRDGWGNNYGDLCWYVMAELVLAKALQHEDVQRWLTWTEEAPIYEDSPVDDIWGWRYEQSYTGKNLLGRCWMLTRGILKEKT